MPNRPLRPCAQPGCPATVVSGRCPKHQRQATGRSLTHEEAARVRAETEARFAGPANAYQLMELETAEEQEGG